MSYIEEIEGLRKQNDRLNAEIVKKIAKWVKTYEKIGALKNGKMPQDGKSDNDEAILEHVRTLALKHSLDVDRVERIFYVMLQLRAETRGGTD